MTEDKYNMVHCKHLLLLLLYLLCSSADAQNYRIMGMSWNAVYVDINPTSGVFTTLASNSYVYNDMAVDPRGRVFAGGAVKYMGRLARESGETMVFMTDLPVGDFTGFAFDTNGILYASVNRTDIHGSPTLPDDLYRVDPASTSMTLVGSIGMNAIQALAFDSSGMLYAWECASNGLCTVNIDTGTGTDVSGSSGGSYDIQALSFAPDGMLYGARTNLYRINKTSGARTLVGANSGPDVRGIGVFPLSTSPCMADASCAESQIAFRITDLCTNQYYAVQQSTDLIAGAWSSGLVFEAFHNDTNWTDATTNASRKCLYRVLCK